ncbi:hypothetical protein [Methylobacterium oryzisoli]|uniref:hypothetical protein n=1 Tax=Methylobacterium oryzisoli TaxID=3385502 RepID=UPI003892BA9C
MGRTSMTPPRWRPDRSLERLMIALEADILAAPEAEIPRPLAGEEPGAARRAVTSALTQAVQGVSLGGNTPGSLPAARRE